MEPLWQKKTSEIGAGFFCLSLDKTGKDNKWRDLIASDYVNTVFCSDAEAFDELAAHNTSAWMGIHPIYDLQRNGGDWQAAFDALWERVCASDHPEALLGWYLDEPSNMAKVKELTKYAKERYNKRFFICFMVRTTDPDVWGGYIDENSHLNKDNTQYLTDIAVDHYWAVNDETRGSYEKLYATLHRVMPDDCKVWYIPNTYASRDLVKEDAAAWEAAAQIRITHTDYMYEWLKNEPAKNRGGILFFAYDFDSDYENLYGMWNINQHTDNAWSAVMDNCARIGREICRGEWDV